MKQDKRNIEISLETAQQWYNGNDSSLKEIALQAFTEDELTIDFNKITCFEAACKALNLDYGNTLNDYLKLRKKSIATAASFKLNIVRKALNKGYLLDFIKGNYYYPCNFAITLFSSYKPESNETIVARFELDNNIFNLLGGYASDGAYAGLGCFYSNRGVAGSDANVGFLGCATKKIAEHLGRYFAKDIFDAKYGDLIKYKWL